MKKTYFVFSILILFSFVLAACVPAAEPTPVPEPTQPPAPQPAATEPTTDEIVLPDLGGREITIAVENAYLPFNYIRLDTGEAEGWDYDFIEEACARLNCVPVWVEFGWDTMIASVAAGQFDMATDGITITEERAQQVDFSEGYVSIEQRLLVRIDEDRFSNIEEFAADPNLLLAEQISTTNYITAVEQVGESRVLAFDTFGLAVQAVISGDADGVIIDEVAGQGYLGANADKVKLIGPTIQSDELGFIFPRGSDLVEPFNLVLRQMKADGFLAQINARWFGPSFTITYDDIGPGAYAEVIGSEEHPIKVLFVPSVDAQVIVSGGEIMAEALHEATGLFFEVSVPTSYAATIEEMCASPEDTMGFIPGLGYVLANQLCGVDVSFKAVRFGWDYYWAQILVARDSDIQSLEDLDGKVWAYPDAGSTSGYLAILPMLEEYGITPSETVEAGGHTGVVRAIYNNEADWGTTFFSPPLNLGDGPQWQLGDDPDIPADLLDECAVSEDGGRLICGNWRVLDARASLRSEAPDVVQKVRILDISDDVPNDTLSFGPDFPEDLRAQIEEALVAFSQTEAWDASIGNQDFYGWTALSTAFDEEYDIIRRMVALAGISLEDLGR
jgi:phosphate/phosphite/phosphonate ABC transporter binding protein